MSVLESFGLQGKTALVTGCNKGIGYGMTLALAEAGANIIGMSSGGDFADIKLAVENTGKSFTYYQVDLGDRAQIYEFVEKIAATQIDILVNNAGIIMRSPAAEHPDEYWDKVMSINLDANAEIHIINNGLTSDISS